MAWPASQEKTNSEQICVFAVRFLIKPDRINIDYLKHY